MATSNAKQRAQADVPADSATADPASATESAATDSGSGSATPVYRAIRDFVVACDNVRRCTIVSAAETFDSTATLQLTLRRDAGADGAQVLSIESPELMLDPASLAPADLRLDGAPLRGMADLPWADGDGAGLRLTSPDAIAQVLGWIGDGKQLGVEGGDAERAISLSGLAAALLLVDEQQQRLDTRGAWRRRGARADADVPAARRLPELPAAAAASRALSEADIARLTATVRRAQSAALRTEDCQEERGADDSAFDITAEDAAEPLDATQAIVFITCLNGAYQASSLVFIAPRDGRGSAKRVVLPPLPFDAGEDRNLDADRFAMLTNAGYDPTTATLVHFAKGRGLADCGDSARWRYDGQAFRLFGFEQLTRCRGGAPGDWPALWRTAGSDDAQ